MKYNTFNYFVCSAPEVRFRMNMKEIVPPAVIPVIFPPVSLTQVRENSRS